MNYYWEVARATTNELLLRSGSSHNEWIIIKKWLEPQRMNYYYKVARATTSELLLRSGSSHIIIMFKFLI